MLIFMFHMQDLLYVLDVVSSLPARHAMFPIYQKDATSVRPGAVSVAEVHSEDWVEMADAVAEGAAPEFVQEFAATGSDGAPPTAVDIAVADAVVGAVDAKKTEKDNEANKEAKLAGEISGTTVDTTLDSMSFETATDQLAPTGASKPVKLVEGSALPLPAGSAPLMHGFSPCASTANLLSGSEPVEAVGTAAAYAEQAAGDNTHASLDDAHGEVEPMALEEETEQRVSASEALAEEEEGSVLAAANGQSGSAEPVPVPTESADVRAEQTMEEIVSDGTAPVEADLGNPAGADAAGSSEGAEAMVSVKWEGTRSCSWTKTCLKEALSCLCPS